MSHASIDGDFSIGDLGDLLKESGNSSYNTNHKSSESAFQFDYAKERAEISQENKSNVRYMKVLSISLLTLLAMAVSLIVFFSIRRQEQSNFEENFLDGAQRIAETWERNLGLQIRAMDSLGIHVTSWVNGSRSTWPMVTVPDFSLRGESTNGFSGSRSTFLLPVVTNEMRLLYEGYTQVNLDWIATAEQATVSPVITRQEGDDLVVDTGEGPFFPAWTMSPIISEVVNFNFASDPAFANAIGNAYESQQIVIGKVHEESLIRSIWQESIGDELFSSMLVPVFQNNKFVALFSTSVIWSFLLENSLSIEDEGHVYLAVMENDCGQVYSFKIHGPSVTMSAEMDAHDSDYDEFLFEYSSDDLLEASKGFVTPDSPLVLNSEYCPYNLRIYPTQELEEIYQSNNPIFYTLSVFFVFLLTAVVFGCYDTVMERRQQRVLSTAVEARAIVANLFPQQFRGRLFEQQREPVNGRVKSFFNVVRRGHSVDANTEGGSPDSSHEEEKDEGRPVQKRPTGMVSQSTLRLKTYLNESSSTIDGLHGVDNKTLKDDKTRPIADLFSDTTVLFADIVGFTSWCSQRDPENVFRLLESVFKAFDKIARKRAVFKVETIGDCYMAVTGLPDPQQDHAWCMAKFALDARTQMAEVLSGLERVLGPDTSELSCRFGMHSGSVTAGVLRGDKSRFQLFGDTVSLSVSTILLKEVPLLTQVVLSFFA
jgi:class 3 adenylate cyclase